MESYVMIASSTQSAIWRWKSNKLYLGKRVTYRFSQKATLCLAQFRWFILRIIAICITLHRETYLPNKVKDWNSVFYAKKITLAKLQDNTKAFHFKDIVTVFSLSQFPVTVASSGTYISTSWKHKNSIIIN